MITIGKSKTADTRSCDFSKVTRETLLESSKQHIDDVGKGLLFMEKLLQEAAILHDFDKITEIDRFHSDFVTGFKEHGWWDNHRKVNRHHLLETDGVPKDVNLVDVLDMIVDCVMAGMGRTGTVYPLNIKPEVLKAAFNNTVELMKANVKVEDNQ
jgi:protein tyrosine phosphatase